MKITKRFLLDNRTKSNAWTAEQFRIIGMTWPPKANWMSLVKDKELTGAEVAEFIRAKEKPTKSKTKVQKAYLCILDNIKELSAGQREILLNKLRGE